jgi:DNA-binding NarL/FixJ family response regulator
MNEEKNPHRTKSQLAEHRPLIVDQLDKGVTVAAIAHQLGISEQSVYNQARKIGYQSRLVRSEMLKEGVVL